MCARVSVIIPAYNARNTIRKAVDSALEQTEGNLEIVIVDDGSTDGTPEVVRTISDPRIRLFCEHSNRGQSHARNRAIREAAGEWIAFLDADDWYAPGRLETLLRVAEEAKVDLVADDMCRVTDSSGQPKRTKLARHRLTGPQLLDPADFLALDCGMQPIIRRRLILQHGILFEEEWRHGEDTLFVLECLLAGGRLVLWPEPLYYYLWRPDSLTTRKTTALEQRIRITEGLLARESLRRDPVLRRLLEGRLAEAEKWLSFYRVTGALKQGRVFQALHWGLCRPSFYRTLGKAVPQALRNRL